MSEVIGFLQLLFGSFFRWWFAVLTGIVTLLSFIFTPSGIYLSRVWVTSLTVVWLILLFLFISTIYQGWQLYRNRSGSPRIVSCKRSDDYNGEFIFLVEGVDISAKGAVAELKPFVNGVEVAFALVEFIDLNSKGQFQAKIVWISPGHLHDLQTGKFSSEDIILEPLIQLRTLNSLKAQ